MKNAGICDIFAAAFIFPLFLAHVCTIEQHGHPITATAFFAIGAPVMVVSLLVANVYLIVTHVLIPWY